jgi:regulator of protease activity HflC (stomatin/prohibitin superfamily)
MMKEKVLSTLPGLPMLLLWLLVIVASVVAMIAMRKTPGMFLLATVALIGASICLAGLFAVQPNQGVVLTMFGRYVGTANSPGLHWVNPFMGKKPVSQRVRNFETKRLKVNDQDGNPIEIAAVVVWKVIDTAQAAFQVQDFENYVEIQSEAALRNMAIGYPYDAHEDGKKSLRANSAEIADHLREEIHDRLLVAGIEVVESRISHLAYAPEIAASMLQRQQASAIVAARQKIVEGAVGMVHMALDALAERGVVQLDEERKAAMVSNLLVVLCGDRSAQPVVNTGTIYH